MPDMSKYFSHHTNRENPLTQYYLAKKYVLSGQVLRNKWQSNIVILFEPFLGFKIRNFFLHDL